MCGIVGIINYRNNGFVSETVLTSMVSALAHRGPDSQGIYINPKKHIGLGHARLSILDPTSNGNQPMRKHDLVVVLNGELFNFEDVKAELINYGYTFFTQSDTEVLLSAFDRWGIDCINKL